MADTPSYLIRRNGIFYFQARIPQNSVLYMKYKNNLIRRSTRTGNKREAMRIARTWWVELMTEQEPDENFDDRMECEDRLYSAGACLYPEYGDIDPRDEETLGHLSAFERESLDFYKEEQKKRRIEKRAEELEIEHKARQILADRHPAVPQAPDAQKQDAPPLEEHIRPGGAPAAGIKPASKTLSELAEEHAYHYTHISKEWTGKTPQTYKSRLKLFIYMVGDMPVQELTADMVRERFAKKLHKLPVRIEQTEKFKHGDNWKPIDEIIAIARKCGDKTISNTTIASYVKVINKFLEATLINDYGCAAWRNCPARYSRYCLRQRERLLFYGYQRNSG